MSSPVVLELVESEPVDENCQVDLVSVFGLESMPLVMSPRTLGEHLEISTVTLQRWRMTWPRGERLGPAFLEPPGANMVRYARADVVKWLHSVRVDGSSESG